MGQDEDNVAGSIAHIVLCCFTGNGVRGTLNSSYIHPGMHFNFFLHGVVGFMKYQSAALKTDVTSAYDISLKATKYLALPCLMADLYRGDHALSALHLASGVIPFALAVSGEENAQLGYMVVTVNLVSLCFYSFKNNSTWGWYTALAACFSYYGAAQMGNVAYPLGLALIDYCACRMFFRMPSL